MRKAPGPFPAEAWLGWERKMSHLPDSRPVMGLEAAKTRVATEKERVEMARLLNS